MPPSPADIIQMNRQSAVDFAASVGVRKTRAVLKAAETDLSKRLAQARGLSGPGSASFTARHLEVTLAQVRDVTKTLTSNMRDVLLDQAKSGADLATQNLVKYMNAADTEFKGIGATPLALQESMLLDRAYAGARSSVLNRLASGDPQAADENTDEHPAKAGILARYGAATIEHFEGVLQTGMLAGKSVADMRDELTSASPFLQQAPAFWAERVVRTETMGVYNRANWESIRAADDDLGDMVKILCMTDDERTGWDSYQVHGQIRLPDEAFEWRDGMYQHPPNRPNDREIVVPHRISWVIPKYLAWRSDEQVMLRYKRTRKTGAPGERPNMTTVDLGRFGKRHGPSDGI